MTHGKDRRFGPAWTCAGILIVSWITGCTPTGQDASASAAAGAIQNVLGSATSFFRDFLLNVLAAFLF